MKFWDPLNFSGTAEATKFKFGVPLVHNEYYTKNAKLGQRGHDLGHVTYFWNFGTPSIFRERFELETSNLACRLATEGTNDNNEKLGKRGSEKGHVTYF